MALIYWHRLENATDPAVVSPAGSAITFSGSPGFSACKFGNGMDGANNTAKYFDVSGAAPKLKGTIDFWFKAGSATLCYLLGDHGGYVSFYAFGSGSTLYIYGGNYAANYTFSLSWSSGEVMHLAFTWDGTAGADQKLKAYKNGSLLSFISSAGGDTSWSDTGTGKVGPVHIGFTTPLDGIIDNFKIWDEVKTTFLERENERYGVYDHTIIM